MEMTAPAPTPSPTPSPAPSPAPAAAAPEGPLAAYWDQTKGALDTAKLTAAYSERDAVFAQHAERMKDVPAEAKLYKAEPILPEGFTMPDGAKVDFDPKQIEAFSNIAHSAAIPQKTVSQLLGLYAAHQIDVAQKAIAEHQTLLAAENAKLGQGGPQRRDAIETFLKSKSVTADEMAEARLLLSTEAGVRFLERMIAQSNGSAIPGHPAYQPPAPAPKSRESILYPEQARKAS
jgi:hypothetical protein